MTPNGYPIGTRSASAAKLAKRNAANAKRAWLEQIPRDPRKLVAVLRRAGVDLDGLREVLR